MCKITVHLTDGQTIVTWSNKTYAELLALFCEVIANGGYINLPHRNSAKECAADKGKSVRAGDRMYTIPSASILYVEYDVL